jgi:hypothetical protein
MPLKQKIPPNQDKSGNPAWQFLGQVKQCLVYRHFVYQHFFCAPNFFFVSAALNWHKLPNVTKHYVSSFGSLYKKWLNLITYIYVYVANALLFSLYPV